MLEVGRITRPHGLTGELAVVMISNRQERLAPGASLATERGPLVVVSSRPHKQAWLVRFEGINDRDQADTWRNTVLLGEPIEDPDELWVHELIGCRVIDQFGTVQGQVIRVLDNPASDLLELDSGALVPVRFVVSFVAGEEITVDTPEGLFDEAAAVSERDET
jgi:16S rRNA processing protein RimM